MAKTVRLLGTHNGYKPGTILTLPDAEANALLFGGVGATLDLTGGTAAFQSSPATGLGSGANLPLNQTISAGQTGDVTVPSGVTVGLSGTSDLVGTWSVVNPDGTTATPTTLVSGDTSIGVFVVDTKVRFNVTFGTLTIKAGVVAGSVSGSPLFTQQSKLQTFEDERGFGKFVAAGGTRVIVKRTPTATAGTFLNTGDVNLVLNGTIGSPGDYLRNIKAEVKAATNGGKAGIFVTQVADAIFAAGTSGTAITNTTTQTFSIGSVGAAAANSLADRVISFEYVPTTPAGNTLKTWHTTRIVSHAAIPTSGTTANLTFVLEDAPDAGAAPTYWVVHGPRAYRALAPDAAPGSYNITCEFESETGGFKAWVGSGVVLAEFFGAFGV